jgi:LysM repeat protein
MNSIRPLITITILVVVGAYLYMKINEGPGRPAAGENGKWLSDMPEDIPPLDATAGAPPVTGDTAATWPATAPAATGALPGDNGTTSNDLGTPPPASDAAIAAEVPVTLPAVPSIPALPEVSATTNSSAAATPASVPLATGLPENIPTARYPDELAPPGAAPSSQPSIGSPPQSAGSVGSTALPSTALNATSSTAPPPADQQPSTLSQNPLRQASEPSANLDGNVSSIYGQNQAAPGASVPVEPSFAVSWPEIKTALDRGELARAHQLLSKWHDDPSLTPAEAEQVDTLLSQLAGTVVYSAEHQLEPARVVKPGETLQSIAEEYSVPWQLLAKINGIASADQVRPGQELKVVRGPFSAVVDLNRKQMTLMVDGRYAGKFPVTAADVPQLGEGEWVVTGCTDAPRVMILNRPSEAAANLAMKSVLLGASTSSEIKQLGIPMVNFSSSDSNEVTEILSVGSRVVIRR